MPDPSAAMSQNQPFAQEAAEYTKRRTLRADRHIVAASGATDMDHAFTSLRAYARRTQARLSQVATELTDGTLTADQIVLSTSDVSTTESSQ